MPFHNRLVLDALLTGALSLTVAGCNKAADTSGNTGAAALPSLPATLPMTNAPAQAVAYAPPPTAIRAPQPIRAVRVADRRAAYAYADQASYLSQSVASAPPDYGFDYDGVRPWAWQSDDGSRVFVEPVATGYRYYYYRSGADRPYFIRDPDYGYGYDGDQLAVVYGQGGSVLPYDDYGPRLSYAAAYLWRAQLLFAASRERQAVSAADWNARQNAISASRERWAADRDRQADWAAYHAEEAAQQSRYWAHEAARRDADQQRYVDWREQDFRTPPPPRVIPPHWQQASWAQDSARYAPAVAVAAGAGAFAYAVHRTHAPARPVAFAAPPRATAITGPAPRPVLRDGQDAGRGSPVQPPRPPFHAQAMALHQTPRPVFAGYGRGPQRSDEARYRQPPHSERMMHVPVSRAAPQPSAAIRPAQVVVGHRGGRPAIQYHVESRPGLSMGPAPGRSEAHVAPIHINAPAYQQRAAAGRAAPAYAPPRDAGHHGGEHPAGDHPGGGHGEHHH